MDIIIIQAYKSSLFIIHTAEGFWLIKGVCSTWQPSAFQLPGYVMGKAFYLLLLLSTLFLLAEPRPSVKYAFLPEH